MSWIRKNPTIAAGGGALLLAIVAFLAFGVFGIQTLFFDDEVSEENPFAVSAGESGRESDATSAEEAVEMNDAMEDKPAEVSADEDMPDIPEIVTLAQGSFEGRANPAEGLATVITDGE